MNQTQMHAILFNIVHSRVISEHGTVGLYLWAIAAARESPRFRLRNSRHYSKWASYVEPWGWSTEMFHCPYFCSVMWRKRGEWSTSFENGSVFHVFNGISPERNSGIQVRYRHYWSNHVKECGWATLNATSVILRVWSRGSARTRGNYLTLARQIRRILREIANWLYSRFSI